MAVNTRLPEKLISELLDMIEDKDELMNTTKVLNPHLSMIFNECLQECFISHKTLSTKSMLKIDSIIDFIDDEINIGHWSNISVELCRIYTVASFIKTVFHLKYHKTKMTLEALRESVKYVDKGILMGAPVENNSELMTSVAAVLTSYIRKNFTTNDLLPCGDTVERNDSQYELMYENIKAHEIDISILPPLEQFDNLYFKTHCPVKLQGCIDHWPAKKKWRNLQYLLQIGGDRTVPVEIGKQYVDENWSQKLMTIREFVEKYYNNAESSIGYLAQHNLFDQIPELREDICIPEYCSLSEDYDKSCDPDINCWFGPAGTVSSLHFDPKFNLLVQVYGTKQIILFPPHDSENLYPFEGTMLSNTSQVDPLLPDLDLFPNFTKTSMYKCLLKEGEMLFIPEKWWHHVVALEKCFSVSFWWQ